MDSLSGSVLLFPLILVSEMKCPAFLLARTRRKILLNTE